MGPEKQFKLTLGEDFVRRHLDLQICQLRMQLLADSHDQMRKYDIALLFDFFMSYIQL